MSGGGWKDASHPLSSKFAVLSAANGCELQEWQTARAVKLRAYELLELQWAIPTERVYIPPINLHDTLRVSASASFSASSTHGGMFTQSWGSDEMDAGPDPLLCVGTFLLRCKAYELGLSNMAVSAPCTQAPRAK